MDQIIPPAGQMSGPEDHAGALAPINIKTAALRQQIVSSLRRAIELGVLRAGDRLVEKDLCARFGVSRTSLREALRDLEAVGVLKNASGRGLIIGKPSPEDMTNMYAVRGAIEMLVVEQFIKNAAQEDITALTAALEGLRTAAPASNASFDAQREYYRLLCRAARNEFAFDLLMNIQLRLSVLRSKSFRETDRRMRSVVEKEHVLQHIVQRDLAGAVAALQNGLKESYQAVRLAAEDSEASF